ncbi:MAG TPA: histidine phosphatase family protein, partial [Kofleriaceae bacterium]|nr:histidine phosphatase family protein [Kofleriaceae bacterium]
MHILLVRHGETAWNREGRYQGRTDTPLSETGVEQVCALRDRLAQVPISVAVSSPLSRARTTAETVV